MINSVRVYEVWNCYEDGDRATLWVWLDGVPPPAESLEWSEDEKSVRVLGPVDRALCHELAGSLVRVLNRMGIRAAYDVVADD